MSTKVPKPIEIMSFQNIREKVHDIINNILVGSLDSIEKYKMTD